MTTSIDFHNIIVSSNNANRRLANEFAAKLDADNPEMFSASELEAFSLIAEILVGSEEIKKSVRESETEGDVCKVAENGMGSAIKDITASYERLYTDSALYEFERDCFAYEFLTA